MFTGKHHDSPSDVPKSKTREPEHRCPCPAGASSRFHGDVAILCTKDNNHFGACDSEMFRLLKSLPNFRPVVLSGECIKDLIAIADSHLPEYRKLDEAVQALESGIVFPVAEHMFGQRVNATVPPLFIAEMDGDL
jgi:hypothetical protein